MTAWLRRALATAGAQQTEELTLRGSYAIVGKKNVDAVKKLNAGGRIVVIQKDFRADELSLAAVDLLGHLILSVMAIFCGRLCSWTAHRSQDIPRSPCLAKHPIQCHA